MKSILTFTLCLVLVGTAPADSARMFDEYGDIQFADEKARLDNLAIHLKQKPDMDVWYYIFAGTKNCEGEARRRAVRAKNYLVKTRGIQPDRVKWVDEGYREHLLVEVWVWPRKLSKPYTKNSSLDKSELPMIRNCKSKEHQRQRRINL